MFRLFIIGGLDDGSMGRRIACRLNNVNTLIRLPREVWRQGSANKPLPWWNPSQQLPVPRRWGKEDFVCATWMEVWKVIFFSEKNKNENFPRKFEWKWKQKFPGNFLFTIAIKFVELKYFVGDFFRDLCKNLIKCIQKFHSVDVCKALKLRSQPLSMNVLKKAHSEPVFKRIWIEWKKKVPTVRTLSLLLLCHFHTSQHEYVWRFLECVVVFLLVHAILRLWTAFLLREPFMPAFGLLKIYCVSHSRHVCAEFFLWGENTFSYSYFLGVSCAFFVAGRQARRFLLSISSRRRDKKTWWKDFNNTEWNFCVCHIKNCWMRSQRKKAQKRRKSCTRQQQA